MKITKSVNDRIGIAAVSLLAIVVTCAVPVYAKDRISATIIQHNGTIEDNVDLVCRCDKPFQLWLYSHNRYQSIPVEMIEEIVFLEGNRRKVTDSDWMTVYDVRVDLKNGKSVTGQGRDIGHHFSNMGLDVFVQYYLRDEITVEYNKITLNMAYIKKIKF
jgi:hypothetical protein